MIAEWKDAQAGNSWRRDAQAYKRFISNSVDFDRAKVWWKTGKRTADEAYTEWMGRWGSAGEESLIAWHALVQEVLGSVDFRHNDRTRRTVRLIRTEKAALMTTYEVSHGNGRQMLRGLNESSSVFQITSVSGSEITVQAVPHSRITGLYLLDRRPGSQLGSFADDSENEFTFVPAGIPFAYTSTVSHAAGDDAGKWGLNISHLRNP